MFTAVHREVLEKYIPKEIASRITEFAMSHLSRWFSRHALTIPSSDSALTIPSESDSEDDEYFPSPDSWERDFDDDSFDLYST